jgi:hypothetical protein
VPERSSNKQPRDLNRIAAKGVPRASKREIPTESTKNPAAVALGRLGGKKGGKARAALLSPERRREIARKAATTRWAGGKAR